jgi:hypothetical protein
MKPILSYPLSDKQLIFDYICEHFLVEKNPFGTNGHSCIYDTPTNGCAVGCILPEEKRKALRNTPFGIRLALENNIADICSVFITPVNADFLEDLQRAHDTAALLTNKFKEAMQLLAADHDLEWKYESAN